MSRTRRIVVILIAVVSAIIAGVRVHAGAGLFLDGGQSNFCAPTGAENLLSNKAHYVEGETAQLTGAGFAPSCDITVRVTRPDGTEGVGTGTTDAQGRLRASERITFTSSLEA